jgi:hypothetical protein
MSGRQYTEVVNRGHRIVGVEVPRKVMMSSFLLSLLIVLGSRQNVLCFAPTVTQRGQCSELQASRHDQPDAGFPRRHVFTAIGAFLAVGVGSPALAADETSVKTVFLTGKRPQVPGEKPKDSGDTKGTRKDPNFLRSISDCKSQCERTSDSDGLARDKYDCLSECQDICCTTYEQCTFSIVPRI